MMRLIIVDNKKENEKMKNEAIAVLNSGIRHYKLRIQDEEMEINAYTKSLKESKDAQISCIAKIKQLEEALKRLNK